jgi:hypothetical protein
MRRLLQLKQPVLDLVCDCLCTRRCVLPSSPSGVGASGRVSALEESREVQRQRSLELEEFVAVPGAILGYSTRAFIDLVLVLDGLFNAVEDGIGLLLEERITCRGSIRRLEDLFILAAPDAASSSYKRLRQKLQAS